MISLFRQLASDLWDWYRSPKNKYYIVSAKIFGCKRRSGFRGRIYHDAAIHCGLYDIRSPGQTIWYPEGSEDLHLSIMFASLQECQKFITCLSDYSLSAISIMRGLVQIENDVIEIQTDGTGKFIRSYDYNAQDNPDSPSVTLEGSLSQYQTLYTHEPIQDLRTFENLSMVPPGDIIYKCHIAPQAYYEQFADNIDNIVHASHLFHEYFDGDGRRKPPNADPTWGRAPKCLVRFDVAAMNDPVVHAGMNFYRVFVLIEFFDSAMAKWMEHQFREGSEWLDERTVRTFCHVTDPVAAEMFFSLKFLETSLRVNAISLNDFNDQVADLLQQ